MSSKTTPDFTANKGNNIKTLRQISTTIYLDIGHIDPDKTYIDQNFKPVS